MYTPRDVERPDPDPNDRPYAGWTHLGFSFLTKNDFRADTVMLQIGIVGPASLAEETQKLVHEITDSIDPQGWDYQLSNEPGINLGWERKWRWYARTISDDDRSPQRFRPFVDKRDQMRAYWGVDVIPHVGALVGNVATYANTGFTARAGYNLPSDFGVNLIRPASVTSAPLDDLDPRVRGAGFSFYLFAGADGRAVARDIFLDGNTFTDSRSVDRDPWVADFSAGFGLVLADFQLTYSHVVRTREFETQQSSTSEFGSVTASWSF